MKNLLSLMLFVLLLTSCSHKDLSKIQNGMTESQVTAQIGEPSSKQQMPMNIAWWHYGDNQLVVIEDGKVSRVVPDIKAAEAEMEKALKNMDTK
ncbi:MAG: hypothetical protein JWO03_539 [Bacteroidetes bacterium]|nr:hypothetical protein [Bacteroidota bacterium]